MLTGAMNADGKEGSPSPNDATVCLNCGQLLLFDDSLKLRKAKPGEIPLLMMNKESWAVIEKAQHFIRQRGRFFTPSPSCKSNEPPRS